MWKSPSPTSHMLTGFLIVIEYYITVPKTLLKVIPLSLHFVCFCITIKLVAFDNIVFSFYNVCDVCVVGSRAEISKQWCCTLNL